MKIIELYAENFKRLKAVTIRPNGDVIEITGKNSQGKSSTIDAIWAALQGSALLKNTPKPVREGCEKAEIRLDLGKYLVIRKWTEGGKNSYLTVTSSDKVLRVQSPQKLLDSLLGDLSFDPLAFIQMSDKDQSVSLMSMLKVDITAIDVKRKTAYDERALVNRDLAKAKVEFEALPVLAQKPEAVDTKSLLTNYQKGVTNNELISSRKTSLNHLEKELAEKLKQIEIFKARIKDCKDQLAALKVIDLDAIKKEFDVAELSRKLVEQYEQREQAKTRFDALNSKSLNLTRMIESFDTEKQNALNAVEMPVSGLSINPDSGILEYNGIPLSQASRSEQLKVAISIAMAQNPELKVMRIVDAAILDDDSLNVLKEIAKSNEYQLWIETINKSTEGGIVIEDGEIKQENEELRL